jgi:hypothetical protein
MSTPFFDHPVFQSEGFDDIDENWRHGAYIGGMAAAYADGGIAADYLRAADLLVDQALKDDLVYSIVLPALFLYRHALELRLKVAVRPEKTTHDLVWLTQQLNQMLEAKAGRKLSDALVARVAELDRHDPRADAFRFHATAPRKGSPRKQHFSEEVWVYLKHLKATMTWIDTQLCEAAVIVNADSSSSEDTRK